jgi:hypothetical protein
MSKIDKQRSEILNELKHKLDDARFAVMSNSSSNNPDLHYYNVVKPEFENVVKLMNKLNILVNTPIGLLEE